MIVYTPFWKTLRKRGESTYSLITRYGISSSTINRIRQGLPMTTTTINDLCAILSCAVSDIIEYVPASSDRHPDLGET